MRRWVWAVTLLVSVLFAAVATPGSPLAGWLVDALAGRGWARLTGALRPVRPSGPPEGPVLRAAVGAMVTPQRTFHDYRDLYAEVAARTGRRLDLVQRRTYRELNDLLVAGEVDLAWVCTGAVADLVERGGARLLAVPVIGGRTDYRAYMIVQMAEPYRDLPDLRGAVFAFTDPLSLTGHRVVVDRLRWRGERVETFFGRTFFTYAHDNSITAVREGLADAACVDSLVYDYLARECPAETAGTRVVWRSARYPIPPLVVPASIDESWFRELQEALVSLDADPGARELLAHLGIDAFVAGDPGLYFER